MKTKVERKQRIDRYRKRGRGRKVFGVLVLGAIVFAGVGLVKGYGHDRARPRDGGHLATVESPEQLAEHSSRR